MADAASAFTCSLRTRAASSADEAVYTGSLAAAALRPALTSPYDTERRASASTDARRAASFSLKRESEPLSLACSLAASPSAATSRSLAASAAASASRACASAFCSAALSAASFALAASP